MADHNPAPRRDPTPAAAMRNIANEPRLVIMQPSGRLEERLPHYGEVRVIVQNGIVTRIDVLDQKKV